MAATAVLPLAMPRRVTGVPVRCREAETVAVVDEIPCEIRVATKAEAPVAYRDAKSSFRAFEGRPYRLLGRGTPTLRDTWSKIAEAALGDARQSLGWERTHVDASPYLALTDWGRGLAGSSRRRGFVPAGGIAFKEVSDDGAAAQAASARGLCDRMLAIGEDLWFRADLPRVAVHPFDRDVGRSQRSGWVMAAHTAAEGVPWSAADFRIDQPARSLAFATSLSESLGLPFADGLVQPFEIVDAQALDGLYRAAGGDELLALKGIVGTVGIAVRGDLGYLSDEGVLAYADGLRLARADDAPGLREWCLTGLPALESAVAARAAAIGRERRPDGLSLAVARAAEIERERGYVAEGDAAALSGLSF